jgi:tRNA threonylcarbamoyladenosine biosynthesis protein TsaB
MRVLAIETSSPRLSLAAGDAHRVLKEFQGPLEWRHAESLFGGMEKILRQVRWPIQSLTGVVVSTGPGSFTGIRIGLAAARALGQALKIPVAGVSSLETLAMGVIEPGTLVCPLINALRGEVFTSLYTLTPQGKIRSAWKDGRLTLPDLLHKLKAFRRDPLLFVGDAADIHKEALRTGGGLHWKFASSADSTPRAGILLQQGRVSLAKAGVLSYQRVLPLYLRSAAAIERRASPSGRAAIERKRTSPK